MHNHHSPEPDAPTVFMRTVKSYVLRAGRVTQGQAKAVETLGPQFLLPYRPALIAWPEAFGSSQAPGSTRPVVLEIGFGMGEATAQIAATLPSIDFLCCEVHQAGVGALLKRIGENGLGNIRICAHDAVQVIDQMLPLASLGGIHIFFPDPWHKTKHNKRRLIAAPFITQLTQRLKPGAYLHCATDWQPYAEQMLQVLSAEPLLQNTAPNYAPKPSYRPLTKFENRGLKLGHGVWDLVFVRV